MSQAFTFEHGGKTFRCRAEPRGTSAADQWWWFEVSNDDRHRYAPFRAEAADRQDDVQTRIVAYYDDLIARRAAPAQSHWRR